MMLSSVINNFTLQRRINIKNGSNSIYTRVNEDVIPDVRLTRSRDGSTGTATFRFANPKY